MAFYKYPHLEGLDDEIRNDKHLRRIKIAGIVVIMLLFLSLVSLYWFPWYVWLFLVVLSISLSITVGVMELSRKKEITEQYLKR